MKYTEVVNQNYHMQGFTSGNGFMYWSFTDSVVKTTMSGTVKCQIEIKGGHLGDIDYYDGRLYASYLGFALPGHEWDDWTSFKLYVFDAEDLHVIDIINMDICDYYKSVAGSEEDTRGFRAIDGVAIGRDPLTNERKIFIACAVLTSEKYTNQIILQCDMNGKYEKEYHVPTGNTVFGIQNLDYDELRNRFWFSTYGPEKSFQPKEMLYSVDFKDCKSFDKYDFQTPYGFEALPTGDFYASIQAGTNGKRSGVAYQCGIDFFSSFKNDRQLFELLEK